jgi:hypothetical protein
VSLGREPALGLLAVVGPLVALLVSFADQLGLPLQTAIIAVAVAVAGVVTSLLVRDEKLVPTLLGLSQALVTLGMAWGFALTADQQAGILTVVGLLVAAYARTQVLAPVSSVRAG